MARVIARDPIQEINQTKQIEDTLFNGQTLRLSALQREALAYQSPSFTSEEGLLKKRGIGSRGLQNSYNTSQAIFVPPMITSQSELISRYTRPISGTASNPLLNQQTVVNNRKIINNLQSAYSGRLY